MQDLTLYSKKPLQKLQAKNDLNDLKKDQNQAKCILSAYLILSESALCWFINHTEESLNLSISLLEDKHSADELQAFKL